MQFTDLTDPDREVLQAAIAASDRLYLQDIQEVGAALRTTSGEIFSAIHFETSTGWANVCGEVAAICCMVAGGHRDLAIIAAVWRAPDGAHYLLPPCGRCREVISDFNPHARVIVTRSSDHWDAEAINNPGVVQVSDLLPLKSHRLEDSA
jgi:cytidine deaminase